MFPAKTKTCILSLFIVFTLSLVNGQDRKITSAIHPGCKECNDDHNVLLFYIRAEGAHDTVHQIWDFTGGVPTMILAVASVNSTLNITWALTTPIYFNFSENPKYSFATAFDKLYEYEDVHDVGYIDGYYSNITSISFKDVDWELSSFKQTDEEVMVQVHGNITDEGITGIIDFRLDLIPFKDYAVYLPHLIHTANSTLVDVSLVNLTSHSGGNATRYALHAILVSTDPASDTMRFNLRKSLDDEHTPGVFEIIEIKSPESYRRSDGGFLQFRPVAYTQLERGVESSTIVHVSPFNNTSIHTRTLHSFFWKADKEDLLVQDMSVSFGESGDGYYMKHNYTAWCLTVGYGAPPLEGFSTFVIAIICVGLGAPLLLALLAAACACARRRTSVPHVRLGTE